MIFLLKQVILSFTFGEAAKQIIITLKKRVVKTRFFVLFFFFNFNLSNIQRWKQRGQFY